MRLIRCFAMFLILMIPIHESQAGALAYTGRMNKAIGGAIIKAAKRSGVAANDPRFAKTVYAAANEATFVVSAGTTAATVAAIAGAPVWATVAVGLGVAAAFGYIAYKAYELASRDDGKLYIQPDPKKPAPPKPKIPTNPASSLSFPFIKSNLQTPDIFINSTGKFNPDSLIYLGKPTDVPPSQWKFCVCYRNISCAFAMSPTELVTKVKGLFNHWVARDTNATPKINSAKFVYYHDDYLTESLTPTTKAIVNIEADLDGQKMQTQSLPVLFNADYVPAVRELLSTDQAAPLIQNNANDPIDPLVLVKIANKLWQNAAAKPGYEGLPYDNANPLTEADVLDWKAENPNSYPTQGDLLNPTNKPGEEISLNPDGSPNTVPNPNPNPDPNPNPNPTPNPGGDITIIVNPTPVTVNVNPEVDFGSYPNNPEPSLENIAPSDIFDQIKSVVLPKTNLEEIGKTGECPKPTISLWTKDYLIDAHCDLFQSIAPVIQSIMLAVYAFLAFLIIMSA